mgnify:CR=1 FL=1
MKIISTLKEKSKASLMVVLFIAVLASCSKKDDPVPGGGNPPPSNTTSAAKEITGLTILKSENANITGDGYFYKSGLKIYITIPLNSTLSDVKVNFSLSAKASIKVENVALTNNSGSLDLSKTLTAIVTAENGTTQNIAFRLLLMPLVKIAQKVLFTRAVSALPM